MICITALSGCGKKIPTTEHKLMFKMESESWGEEDGSSDYIGGSYWTVYYDGTVEFYNEYNLSGSGDEESWELSQEERNDLYGILVGDFTKYTEDYNASDGTGWHMTSYDEKGKIMHQFDGYIYDNEVLNEIVEMIEKQ